MRATLIMFGALVGPMALAQSAPVSVGEANAAMDRVDAAIRRTLRLPAAKASTDLAERAVTRAEVIARLDRMFETYRPKFKMTPRPATTVRDAVENANKDPKTVASILKLSRYGCMGPVGYLAVGPSDTIQIEQLGDALGFFLTQIASLTYTADPKWTPALQPPDGLVP